MYCKECGTKLDDNQKFCQNCGAGQDINSSINNQVKSYANKSIYANNTSYTIDPKMYLGMCVGFLGTILLCVLPFMKSGFFELCFFDFLKTASNRNGYGFVVIMSFVSFGIGISGLNPILMIKRLPRLYSKFISSGKDFKAKKLLNNFTNKDKGYLVACLVPVLWLFAFAVTDSDDIQTLSAGFWLCSLCLVAEGILFFISEPPTEQYITSSVASKDEKRENIYNLIDKISGAWISEEGENMSLLKNGTAILKGYNQWTIIDNSTLAFFSDPLEDSDYTIMSIVEITNNILMLSDGVKRFVYHKIVTVENSEDS